ncbi:MAG: hypothetical protein QOC81_1765, partial [Thermoanaerobaculia bacterium]|nr:hypothetical protein [Thermoanaerobaculia bacterium]
MDYRIVSARSKISDVRGILSSWKPQDAADTDQILQDFRDRVHIEIDADPESELLTLLANEFRADEPLAATHRWLGRLIHAASTQNGFVAAGKEIWNDLNGLSVAADANKTRPSIYFWQQRDRPPVGVQTGSYLTGERPLPRHLRLGFFANREAVLGPLSAKITAWLTPHPASSDDSLRLPIFWIGGRSGTGKSVALLQVLSRIHAEQIGPILWLGPHIAALPEAIRWSQRVRRPGETVVIALDDPYAPAAQYDAVTLLQQAISELVTARQGDDPTELPVLLCCGPTEQAERFDRELADDIRLTREDLPHENSKDHATLRQWFRERTGSEPPEIGDGDVLLVQLFFEWRVGATLPEFANRLRQRIAMAETSDHEPELTGQFSRILALNRLYVGYPRRAIEQALTAPQRGVFLRLQRENHLVADPDDERPGVWLAHPHLSNAIYAAWHSGSADEPVRRDHLMQGIFSAIEHGENPSQQQSPLWAISRALDSTLDDSTLADRLAGENLVSLLQDIYLTLIKRYSGTLPLTHLPVWIEIRSLHPEIFLEPDPVDAGITALLAAVTGEPGLRLTSHKLLQHLRRYSEDVRTRIADATTFLLGRTTQWREWVPIMLDAIPRFRRPEMGSIIARWVEDHNNHMMVPPLLELGLKHAIGAEIREKALHVIATAGEGIAWGDVALLLLGENAASVPNEVAVWTERHRSTFGVCFVLGRLLNSHYSPAVAWSIEWARIWHLERRANWVLEPLVQFGEGNPNISVWSEAWIRAGYPNAGRLIQLRLKAHSDDTSLRNLSVEWLRQTEYSDGSWSYAWEGLWNSAPGEDELVELGIRWLEATLLEQRSWSFVWFALYRNSPVDAQLRELALRWFASAPPDHVSWAFIWTALDKRAPGDAQLRELALAWLRSAPPGHGSWQYVWTALHEAAPGDAQLRDVALAWLVSAPPDHGSWAFIWLVLDQETPRDAQLRELALGWLASAPPDHGSWKFVWEALNNETPGNAQLRDLALAWLKSAPPDHGSWAFIWEALDKATPGDTQLRDLALRWLASAPSDHGGWQYVWRALHEAAPGDAQLRDLALRWLASAPPDHGSWAFIWGALDKTAPGDAQLRELALAWLRSAPRGHGSWQYVWTALHEA